MTRFEALRILRLNEGASADSIKKAFKKRAFETHPDRGGTAAEFLKVQAAYEILNNYAGEVLPDSALESVLSERLSDISRAFEVLYQESNSFCHRTFEEFHEALLRTIHSYESYSSLRDNAQRDITSEWSDTVKTIAGFVEERVGTIADRHDQWLQEYLRPVVLAARLQNPPYWFERIPVGSAFVLSGLALLTVASMLHNGWVGIPAVVTIGSGIALPLRYHYRFAAKRIVRGVRLSDLSKKSGLRRLDVHTDWVSEEGAGTGGGFIGASVGAIFLGPIGAAVGGALGAMFGWLIGESLTTRKEKLYQSVVREVDLRIPEMMAEFNRRLRTTEDDMVRAVKDNFGKNVRTMVKLLKSSSVPPVPVASAFSAASPASPSKVPQITVAVAMVVMVGTAICLWLSVIPIHFSRAVKEQQSAAQEQLIVTNMAATVAPAASVALQRARTENTELSPAAPSVAQSANQPTADTPEADATGASPEVSRSEVKDVPDKRAVLARAANLQPPNPGNAPAEITTVSVDSTDLSGNWHGEYTQEDTDQITKVNLQVIEDSTNVLTGTLKFDSAGNASASCAIHGVYNSQNKFMFLVLDKCQGRPPADLQGKIGFSSVEPTAREVFGVDSLHNSLLNISRQ
jgi:hypothetical protein